uniref:Cyclic nucleotide-binding domain-containing protein n=1 Tax=Rhabditophanes sp. KR3021 TaxID=114890 RepID=A0AC35U780_9BILA
MPLRFGNDSDKNTPDAGAIVFIIIAVIAVLCIVVTIVFLLISSSRRKNIQSRMGNLRRSLTNSFRRNRQNGATDQIGPMPQNITIDSTYLTPASIMGLSPPKYDSAPPSYDEVLNTPTEATPPYTPSRIGSTNITPSQLTSTNINNPLNQQNSPTTQIIRPRITNEDNTQREINRPTSTAIIEVTEMVTTQPRTLSQKQNSRNIEGRRKTDNSVVEEIPMTETHHVMSNGHVHSTNQTNGNSRSSNLNQPFDAIPSGVAVDIDNQIYNVSADSDDSYFKKFKSFFGKCAGVFNIEFICTNCIASVDPTSDFYYYWTVAITIGCLYNLLFLVVFIYDDVLETITVYWRITNVVVDFMFLGDALVQSCRTYMENGLVVNDLTLIIPRYLMSEKPLIDMLAIFPIDMLLDFIPQLVLLRMNRFMKLYRVNEFVERTSIRTAYPHAFRISVLISICFIIFHWNSSAYYSISLLGGTESEDVNDWAYTLVKNADPIFPQCDIFIDDNEGDCGFDEKPYIEKGMRREEYVNEMMAYWSPLASPYKFSDFRLLTNDKTILASLPRRLECEIAEDLHMSSLKNVAMFAHIPKNVLLELVMRLERQMYAPDDFLCRIEDPAREMYIVKAGCLSIVDVNQEVVDEILPGASFGDNSIIKVRGYLENNKRTFGLKSKGYSDVYILRRESVNEVLRDYPEERSKLGEFVRLKLTSTNLNGLKKRSMDVTELTDLHNTDEMLTALARIINEVDEEITELQKEYGDSMIEIKQRMTKVENVYKKKRLQIKDEYKKRLQALIT